MAEMPFTYLTLVLYSCAKDIWQYKSILIVLSSYCASLCKISGSESFKQQK